IPHVGVALRLFVPPTNARCRRGRAALLAAQRRRVTYQAPRQLVISAISMRCVRPSMLSTRCAWRTRKTGTFHSPRFGGTGVATGPRSSATSSACAMPFVRLWSTWMLRSNDEVFRAFNELRQTSLPADVELRIQGNSTSPLASREFHYMFEALQATPTAVLRPDFVERIAKRKDRALADYGHVWDVYSLELAVCLAAEFQELHEGEATYQDLQEFIQELARKDDGHFAKLYEKQYDRHLAKTGAGKRRREVVLTTMHKVKGLEFDAVVIPPSLADFGIDKSTSEPADNLADLVQEERRLFYVAYTRARYRLVVLRHEREAAVAAGQVFQPEEADQGRGYAVKEGSGKVQLYWGAQDKPFFAELHTRIFTEIKVGDPIVLVNDKWDSWVLTWKNRKVGKLGFDAATKLPDRTRLEGLLVSNINRYTLTESLAYDAKHNKSYTEKWGAAAKERGYIYIVDFAGYCQMR
ncbi:MAG: hypothetical protein EOO60_07345, partial [Hymenobacter sp.]